MRCIDWGKKPYHFYTPLLKKEYHPFGCIGRLIVTCAGRNIYSRRDTHSPTIYIRYIYYSHRYVAPANLCLHSQTHGASSVFQPYLCQLANPVAGRSTCKFATPNHGSLEHALDHTKLVLVCILCVCVCVCVCARVREGGVSVCRGYWVLGVDAGGDAFLPPRPA